MAIAMQAIARVVVGPAREAREVEAGSSFFQAAILAPVQMAKQACGTG